MASLPRPLASFAALAVGFAAFGAGAQLSPQAVPVLPRRAASKLLVNQVKPSYPPLANQYYIEGKVRLEILVDPRGVVSGVHVLAGHPFLAAAAIKAVKRWVYRPWVRSSGPTPFRTEAEVNFTLRHRHADSIPPQAEKFLQDHVRPPELLSKPNPGQPTSTVRLQVLVDDGGRVIDAKPLSGVSALDSAAEADARKWQFRPAYLGNLPVPWYVVIDVAVGAASPAGPGWNRATQTPERGRRPDQAQRLL